MKNINKNKLGIDKVGINEKATCACKPRLYCPYSKCVNHTAHMLQLYTEREFIYLEKLNTFIQYGSCALELTNELKYGWEDEKL